MAIDYALDDAGIARITINRPDKANALDQEHYAALSRAWIQVRDDPAVRVAVVTGAGDKAFCAGADLKSYIGRDQEIGELWLTQKDPLLNRGLEVWKPVIAAVNGACVGGGMTLLLATDIRVAVPHATFGLPEVKRGVIAANGGTQRVIAQLPHCIAMALLLTGDAMPADEAARWGLINAVVEPAGLIEAAYGYARRIAANAPLAVQAAKELAVRARDLDLAAGLRLEQLISRTLQQSDDVKEGRAAFAEKRAPKFRGR